MKFLHKAVDVLALGLRSLTLHKVRSLLSVLGIIFGVCGVILMLALNEGSARRAQEAFRELGSDNIIIDSVKPPEDGEASESEGAMVYGLTYADVERLRGNIPGVRRCAISRRMPKDAYNGARKASVMVAATEPIYSRVARTAVAAGRFISHADVLRRKPHCVITRELAEKLFPLTDPLGSVLRLDGNPYVVIGVLEELPAALTQSGGKRQIIIPLSTAQQRFGEYSYRRSGSQRSAEKVEVSQVILQMDSEQSVLDGAAVARSLLERFHDERDYQITVPRELIEQKAAQMAIWHRMFLGIAAISLLVGGIGIMNIMLASVTERTREIGIRRALGAKRRDIAVQFLIEAVALTLVGGLIGIAIGVLAPRVLERWNVPAVVEPVMLVLPLVTSLLVGLLSGLYPAVRAARLDPIEALRHE